MAWEEKLGILMGKLGLNIVIMNIRQYEYEYEYPCNISDWYLLVRGYKSGGEIFKWRWYMD